MAETYTLHVAGPVSYTHLDVYKRQVKKPAARKPRTAKKVEEKPAAKKAAKAKACLLYTSRCV